MDKKVKLTDILLILAIGLIVYNMFFMKDDIIEPEPVTVTIPEEKGTSGTQYIEPKIVVVQVPVGNNQNINVDSYWKEKYENATQKQKDSLYNQAIRVNKYNDTLVEDDRITITGEATTRGSLLDFKVDYVIKPLDYTYTPKIVTKVPSLTLDVQAGMLMPSLVQPDFTLPLQVGFTTNVKGLGQGVGAGYMYEPIGQNHGAYIKKSFVIIK